MSDILPAAVTTPATFIYRLIDREHIRAGHGMVRFQLQISAATDLLPSLMALLKLVASFHRALIDCITYERVANRITFGCCIAASTAATLTASVCLRSHLWAVMAVSLDGSVPG
jgi:hypothetical protein